jgi:hypothetical protein
MSAPGAVSDNMTFVEPTFSERLTEPLTDQEGVGQPQGSPPASSRAAIGSQIRSLAVLEFVSVTLSIEVGQKVVMGIDKSHFAWVSVSGFNFGSPGGLKKFFKYTRVYDPRIRPPDCRIFRKSNDIMRSTSKSPMKARQPSRSILHFTLVSATVRSTPWA